MERKNYLFLGKRYIILAAVLLFGLQNADMVEARRVYDTAAETQVHTPAAQDGKNGLESRHRKKKVKEKKAEETEEVKKPSLAERIEAILHPPAPPEPPKPPKPAWNKYDTSIEGLPIATPRQCVSYLLKHNPYPSIAVPAHELVRYYYEEGEREEIRPDLAFAQAIKETGFFRYGGTVTPDQNNYCGLGTTSASVKGGYFATPQIGVRAQIQHLMAYCTTRLPQTAIVDPRYWLVRESYGDDVKRTWPELNGRWAVPGPDYGESIMFILSQILLEP